MQASGEEGGYLNVNPSAVAMMGEERWVGGSDDNFLWC